MRERRRGKIWTQRDRFGNDIYLTYERWSHIIAPDNHPQVESYDEHLREEEKFIVTAYFQFF